MKPIDYLLPAILAAAAWWLLFDAAMDMSGARELARVVMEARP